MKQLSALCVLCAVLALASCATTNKSGATADAKPSPTNGGGSWTPGDAMAPTTEPFTTNAANVYENVAYASVSAAEQCDIYVPAGDGAFPVIVLVHGGGFAFQNQKMKIVEPVAQYALFHGYAVVSVDYRKSSEAVFPAALSDVKAAVRFVRANAATYRLDAERIAVWGKNAPSFITAGAETFNRDVPNAEVHFVNSGHFALESCCAEICEYIRKFAEKVCL